MAGVGLIGVDSTLDERWASKSPECGLDHCERCGECLGCVAGETCFSGDEGGFHPWLNSREEVLLV